MDEARVWNYARSAQQIGHGSQIEVTSAPGLRARWGLNEGAGSVIADSSGQNITGTLVGSNVAWAAGAPFAGNNAPPIAVTDAPTTPESTPVTIAVLANDTDADGDPLTLTTVGTPAHGTASINPNGTVTYAPVAGFNGQRQLHLRDQRQPGRQHHRHCERDDLECQRIADRRSTTATTRTGTPS